MIMVVRDFQYLNQLSIAMTLIGIFCALVNYVWLRLFKKFISIKYTSIADKHLLCLSDYVSVAWDVQLLQLYVKMLQTISLADVSL